MKRRRPSQATGYERRSTATPQRTLRLSAALKELLSADDEIAVAEDHFLALNLGARNKMLRSYKPVEPFKN